MRTLVTLSMATVLLTVAVAAQPEKARESAAEPPATDATASVSLVGHWVPETTARSGLGTIWTFKPDGTLTRAIGVVANGHYRIEGDTLVLPPEVPSQGAQAARTPFRVAGDHLYQRPADAKTEVSYVRIQGGKPGDPPIVGVWKLAEPPTGNQLEAVIKNTTYTYTRDGLLKMRATFRSTTGSYDLASGTYTLDQSDHLATESPAGAQSPAAAHAPAHEPANPAKGRFELRNGKLYVTAAGASTAEAPYVKDDFE